MTETDIDVILSSLHEQRAALERSRDAPGLPEAQFNSLTSQIEALRAQASALEDARDGFVTGDVVSVVVDGGEPFLSKIRRVVPIGSGRDLYVVVDPEGARRAVLRDALRLAPMEAKP